MSKARQLSEAEISALHLLAGGAIIAAHDLPTKTCEDAIGRITPGARIWSKMAKEGMVLFPEEEPCDLFEDGEPFTFSSLAEMTDAGRRALREGIYDPEWPETIEAITP